jgi:hypothetical protein
LVIQQIYVVVVGLGLKINAAEELNMMVRVPIGYKSLKLLSQMATLATKTPQILLFLRIFP